MRALDLFRSAGGVSMGLHRAGFDVEGIDIKPQPHYPFRFTQMDALKADLSGYDLICASPPCQKHTRATLSQRTAGKEYQDLIAETRVKLIASGTPWIIENVPGAPMRPDVILCGSMFDLRLIRHRWFECSFPIFNLMECHHHPHPVVAAGHGTPSWVRKMNGGRGFTISEVREAMGIEWMNRDELSLAIPPAYAEFLGRKFLSLLPSTPPAPTQPAVE